MLSKDMCNSIVSNSKVSVIVPVYNVEGYLSRCLESLVRQTLKEIEIILVDDGSIDSSGTICEDYAAKDNRIRVIHKANGGLSSARNAGIKIATAEHIMFVDSDDYVDENYCLLPYEISIEKDIDIVCFDYYIGQNKKSDRKRRQSGFKSKQEAVDMLFDKYGSVAWDKLYRKRLFTTISYPEGRKHEDEGTTYKLFHIARSIYYLNVPLYHYCQRKESISRQSDTSRYDDAFELRKQQESDLENWGYLVSKNVKKKRAIAYLIYMGYLQKHSAECMKILDEDGSPLYDESIKRKMLYGIYKLSKEMFDKVCTMLNKRV